MISLKLDPKGEKIFTSGNNNTTASFGTDIMDSSQAAKLQELTVRVKELESELERYQVSVGQCESVLVSVGRSGSVWVGLG